MRVVIAEDEALLRHGLQALLEGAGFCVVAAVGDAPALVAAVARERPGLVLTDIRMPPDRTDDGLRAAIAVRRAHPDVGVMVLSQHVRRAYALALIGGRGAGVGYLLKQRIGDVDRFCEDLRRVGAGETVLDPEVIEAMVSRASRPDDAISGLTPRQREVLALVAEGRSNAAIAQRLTVSEKGVVQHVSRIYDVLGLEQQPEDHRRVLAVLRYLESGALPPGRP